MNNSSLDKVSLWLTQMRPELLRYCLSLTRNNVEAEDLTQDSIIKVLDRWKGEADPSISKSYLFTIAHNLWIDTCRKRQRHPEASLDEAMHQLSAPAQQDFIVTRELLEQLMHRLNPKTFVLLLLTDIFGLTAKETAHCIQMTEGSVQVALSRARSRLRQLATNRLNITDVEASSVSKNVSSRQLLDEVMQAFRLHDFHRIYRSYLRLYEHGSQLKAIRLQAGRMYFTFRDPDGNLLMISETFF